ncbi:MAG TPA: cytochrome c oxidase assembly protein [Streptosporangiaceae bacterium]|nr:cytochrome c oxidase assembly protein [Streptosporangiaceae bacterium]
MEVAFGHWSASWPVLIAYALAAAWHLTGLRRLLTASDKETGSGRELQREAALYQLGLLVVLLALVSPVGYFADLYLWVRAVQELLVAIVGPGLIVLGAPWTAFRLAAGRPAASASPGSRPRLAAKPRLAVIAANVVWIGWQVPALLDAAHASSGLALVEHASWVAAGLLFWPQLISSRPVSQQSPPLRRIVLLVGSVAAFTVLGMVLVFGSSVLYPGYANSAHHVMSLLSDQQLSGAVFWMGFLPPAMVAAVALMMEWLRDEESADLSAGLDRLLTPRRNGWPSRPVIR